MRNFAFYECQQKREVFWSMWQANYVKTGVAVVRVRDRKLNLLPFSGTAMPREHTSVHVLMFPI